MTNIRSDGIWPSNLPEVLNRPSLEAIKHLLDLRKKTYMAFAEIEEEKGFLKKEMSLSRPEGQEAVRILTQRGLEEMVEAIESYSRDHYLEELIDSVNYFWVLSIIDPLAPTDMIADTMLDKILTQTEHSPDTNLIGALQVGQTVCEMNPVFERLRHRAWMRNPQSQYFDGWHEVAIFLGNNISLIISQFESWSDFVQFYIAKDNVLQFRIKSKY